MCQILRTGDGASRSAGMCTRMIEAKRAMKGSRAPSRSAAVRANRRAQAATGPSARARGTHLAAHDPSRRMIERMRRMTARM